MSADGDRVIVHTDGACSGNPGPGGWGAILEFKGREKEIFGGAPDTTNNRMELTAAIEALKALSRACIVELHTDSEYLRNGITKWIHGWKRNGWRTADKKPVKNADLWQALDQLIVTHKVDWRWVRGHAGHDLNERADALARKGMAPFLKRKKGRAKMAKHSIICAGIDTGKRELEVALEGGTQQLTVDNAAAGHAALSAWLERHRVKRVGIEATGGYEGAVVAHLRGAGFTVVVLQPM